MRIAVTKIATLLLIFALAGCGQKGPLYLPKDSAKPAPKTQNTAPTSATAAPAATGEDADQTTPPPKDASSVPPPADG